MAWPAPGASDMNTETTPMFDILTFTREVAEHKGDHHIVRSCELLEDELHWLEHMYLLPAYES